MSSWYWCLRHSRVENSDSTTCPPEDRMGPYESQEAATHWKDRLEARNDAWDRDDRESSGEDG